MLNSNPETVSTDYDTSDRRLLRALTRVEDVLNVVESERPEGIIVQFGGQTPLSLATRLEKALKDDPIPTASGNGNCKILSTPTKPASTPRRIARGGRRFSRSSTFSSPRRRRGSGGGARRGEQHQVPRHGASLVRARRPHDGNRLLRHRLEALHHHRRRGGPRETRARGQVPEQRHRLDVDALRQRENAS